jgi:hypothetical protein
MVPVVIMATLNALASEGRLCTPMAHLGEGHGTERAQNDAAIKGVGDGGEPALIRNGQVAKRRMCREIMIREMAEAE